MRFQPTASLAALASRRLKRGPLCRLRIKGCVRRRRGVDAGRVAGVRESPQVKDAELRARGERRPRQRTGAGIGSAAWCVGEGGTIASWAAR